MEERAAVERLKSGDAGGLEPLMRRHHVRAVRAAYLIVRDRELAEEVAQGAFLRAFEKIRSFDEGRAFGPWFTKLLVNDALKAAYRRERTASMEVADAEGFLIRLADPGVGPQELAERSERRRRVWTALEQLPPAQRAAVVQRHYLVMSEAEMSENEESPPGTIKSRLHLARKALSNLLRPLSIAAEDAQATRERPAPAPAVPDSPVGKERL